VIRRTVLILFLLSVIGAVLFQTSRRPAAAPARASAPPANPVSVATASDADIPIRLSALGSVTALNTVTVRPRVDGQLMRVLFREGQFVNRGDLLAQIDPRPFQVQLEQAQGQLARDQAQLANARVDLGRYQTLWSEDSIARQNVDAQQSTVAQLEAALKVDQAAIDAARLNLTYARITAPLGGRVGLRLVDEGNVVSASGTSGQLRLRLRDVRGVVVVASRRPDRIPDWLVSRVGRLRRARGPGGTHAPPDSDDSAIGRPGDRHGLHDRRGAGAAVHTSRACTGISCRAGAFRRRVGGDRHSLCRGRGGSEAMVLSA
jgi:multidrug efflux pump subunit AcrA (membrane-fusion protein)